MRRAEKHLDPCEDIECKFNLRAKCCYGMRRSSCWNDFTEPTISQKQIVAELIEEWYIKWKDRMTANGEPHSLGFAKEDLKAKLEKIL